MNDLLVARAGMAASLAFHILFAVAGIAMPLFMVLSQGRGMRSGDPTDLELTRRWRHGTAILFAVGAVSGTVLSFELGLLWPEFMRWAGPVIGMPFSLEGFAFFLEAIFLGLYLYGEKRLPPAAHLACGVVVAVSGAFSAVFVVMANAWMNSPAGFRMAGGQAVDIRPFEAMFNDAAFQQVLHMLLAAYASVAWLAAGIHAAMLLRRPGSRLHRRALEIVVPVAAIAALLQPLSGDLSAKWVARRQPAKLAAMEGQFRTERHAPLRIGGWPDEDRRETRGAIELPSALSWLAHGDPAAEVTGLEAIPREDWPPVAVTHVAFQVMVGCGSVLALVALLGIVLRMLRRDPLSHRAFLRLLVAVSPLGVLALEAGWVVTEVGRQPWIVYGVLRTRDAVTGLPGLVVPVGLLAALYVALGAVVVRLLSRHVFASAGERR